MRKVDIEQTFMNGKFSISEYDNINLDFLIREIESVIKRNYSNLFCSSLSKEEHTMRLVKKLMVEIFPSFSDDDVELALEKMYEEIEGIEGGHVIERDFNDAVSEEKQILLYWYRQREALFVNWKHIQEIS